jgi:hypothetical protein
MIIFSIRSIQFLHSILGESKQLLPNHKPAENQHDLDWDQTKQFKVKKIETYETY